MGTPFVCLAYTVVSAYKAMYDKQLFQTNEHKQD